MQFNIKTYQPINYRDFVLGNPARQGVNLLKLNLLNEKELEIWNASTEFHDGRDDPGHAEFSTIMALRTLPYYPNAKREIVIPTIMLHDDGWYGGDPNAWKRMVEEARKNGTLESLDSPEKRQAHQDKGAERALALYEKFDYPREEYRQESAEIIRDHDTRLHSTTPSGKAVWDADYAWRVSLPCTEIYSAAQEKKDLSQFITDSENTCISDSRPRKSLNLITQQIARVELANTLYFKFGEEAEPILTQRGYAKELELVKAFYSQAS